MDLDSLANLGEFIGGIFVLVTLIYLAYQIRQNTRSLRIENHARVLERMSSVQSRLAVDPELNHVFMVGAEDPARLTRAERIRFAWALYEMFGAAEFMYHQSRERALPPEVWARWEATLGWWMSHPGIRAWWATKPAPLARDFEGFVERVIAAGAGDLAAIERWRGFVAGDELTASGPKRERPAA